MQQPDTVRDIHALIDELDKHLIGMQRLIDEGRKIRAELVLRLGQAVANRNDP